MLFLQFQQLFLISFIFVSTFIYIGLISTLTTIMFNFRIFSLQSINPKAISVACFKELGYQDISGVFPFILILLWNFNLEPFLEFLGMIKNRHKNKSSYQMLVVRGFVFMVQMAGIFYCNINN